MKKIVFLAFFGILSFTSYGQYRWEVSAGGTFSNINLENTDTSSGIGFYVNAGYGYVSGYRAKTSIVFSVELLQRNSELDQAIALPAAEGNVVIPQGEKLSALQIGFNPKFRFLFNRGKDRFRPFVNVGPAIRYNASFKAGDVDLESSDQFEQLVISGVYGAGFSQMVGEMFDIMAEVGVTNDFTDNLVDIDSKFFDVYARVGVRFRIYDARR
ncbi:outer membrane beta-barrel protein [Aquimarina sp. MMG016]|uniref:outer membrane beta-barrel protein n=1 Tax=Aquimarina sp. MMG016 TaxID=2822690 RepID=UPI001B39D504|nr:outer membrane beta-barrel protein [Aquimarina sp. MMG016]MBQ4819116.1 outer membrane beta-barrel protein [Aquimarina sp. MMG016]